MLVKVRDTPKVFVTFLRNTEEPMARTQKARGFTALQECSPFPDHRLNWQPLYAVGGRVYPDQWDEVTLPCFARPCPMRPRHGFVESRQVDSVSDVLRVLAETRHHDPEGEVIFMPRLTGKYSGIANHSGVTYGVGNDGATAGTSAVFIPAWTKPSRFKQQVGGFLVDYSQITHAPYIEFVEHKGMIVPVQLRDGPEIPRGANFIPADVTVTKVIPAEGDLLDWETRINVLGNAPPGVVVWHPKGSLSSHYAVHAILHHIPVIIDHEPWVGEELKASNDTPRALTKTNYLRIARWIEARLAKNFGKVDHDVQEDMVRAAVATLHASPQWGNDVHLLKLRAEGVCATMIFTACACIGEDRHFYGRVGPGHHRNGGADAECQLFNDVKGFALSEDDKPLRERVYDEALKLPLPKLRQYLAQATRDLGHPDWQGNYGGSSWKRCGNLCLEGFEALDKFIEHPTELKWQNVMSAYNRVINATHNNGKVLTKWVRGYTMDQLSMGPAFGFISPYVADLCLGLSGQLELEFKEAA